MGACEIGDEYKTTVKSSTWRRATGVSSRNGISATVLELPVHHFGPHSFRYLLRIHFSLCVEPESLLEVIAGDSRNYTEAKEVHARYSLSVSALVLQHLTTSL